MSSDNWKYGFNGNIKHDCPCWNCEYRGDLCKSCEKIKEWRELRRAISKDKALDSNFSGYGYDFCTKYRKRNKWKIIK